MPDTERTVAQALDLPFQQAIDFFKQKARVPTEVWTDVWRTAHAHSFMVAGAATDALLEDFQSAITKALETGTTLDTFRTDFDAIVAKHGWEHTGSAGWRSRIIYETNLAAAYSAGRYDELTDPDVLRHFPYWTYVHSGSSHPRMQHLAWDGLSLRADDAFWDAHYPPNGWNCGCRVMASSDEDLGRRGKSGPDPSPPVANRMWRDKNSGEIHTLPVGIDPGFDYNVGKAWKAGPQALPVRGPRWEPVGAAPAVVVPPGGDPAALK